MTVRSAVLVVVAALIFSACSSSSSVSSEPGALRWLAVGDSYSSGEGLPDAEGECSNSPSAYAPVASSASGPGWHVEQFVFSACTSAETDDWPAQLQTWGTGRPNVITATFGGNDIGFADVLKDCIGLDDGVESLADITELDLGSVAALLLGRGCDIGEDDINRRIEELEPILVELHEMMADVVGPEGNVFILGYPAPFADPDSWALPLCEGVSSGDAEMLVRASDRLNETIANATDARPNVHFVDLEPVFAGHGRCSKDEWFYGLIDLFDIKATGVDDATAAGLSLIEEARPFHPNEAGHLAMTTALETALESVYPSPG